MAKVNVIYHHFPHYRRPVLRELVKSGVHEYRFFGSLDDFNGVKTFRGDELVTISPIGYRMLGSIWVLKGYLPALLDRSADVLVVHGHPNMPASWIIGMIGRLTGKKIVHWTHGWLRREAALKSSLRRLHYSLAHKVMTYAERARNLAGATGFPVSKIVPIYNSLDWPAARVALKRLDAEGIEAVRTRLNMPSASIVINCVARLTASCRFDLLLEAMAILKSEGIQTALCLVGEGPERQGWRPGRSASAWMSPSWVPCMRKMHWRRSSMQATSP